MPTGCLELSKERRDASTFSLSTFAFDESVNGEETYQPYFKFADNT